MPVFCQSRRQPRRLTRLTAAAALGVIALPAAVSDAEPIDIMAIGNSIAWGFQYENTSLNAPATTYGGWRLPLGLNLGIGNPNDYTGLPQYSGLPTAADPRFVETFRYVGVKGDDVDLTVPSELGRTSNIDDSGDGNGNTTDFRHEGYSGWYIDDNASGLVLSDGRSGILDNLVSQGGAIDPGSADVIMLSIGVNDLLRRSNGNIGSYTVTEDVDRLNALITQIQADAPDATIIVSNLLPFNGSPFTFDATNTEVDAFNDDLLARYFGGTFDSDGLAAYDSLTIDDVYLLDVNGLFLDELGTDPLSDFINDVQTNFGDPNRTPVGDNLHPTLEGYLALGDIYTETFVNLAIGIPEPSSGLLVALGVGLAAARRRRND